MRIRFKEIYLAILLTFAGLNLTQAQTCIDIYTRPSARIKLSDMSIVGKTVLFRSTKFNSTETEATHLGKVLEIDGFGIFIREPWMTGLQMVSISFTRIVPDSLLVIDDLVGQTVLFQSTKFNSTEIEATYFGKVLEVDDLGIFIQEPGMTGSQMGGILFKRIVPVSLTVKP